MIFQRFHLPVILNNDIFRLISIVERNLSLAKELGSNIDVPFFSKFDDAPTADLCLLATPPSTRETLVKAALGKGMHVFCEKPFSYNAESARKMIRCAEKAGRKIYVGQTRRFYPNLMAVRRFARSSFFGAKIDVCYYEGTAYKWSAFSDDRAVPHIADYGIIHDVGSHVFDFIALLLSDARVNIESVDIRQSIFDREVSPNTFCGSFRWCDCRGEGTVDIRLSRTIEMANVLCVSGIGGLVFTRPSFDGHIYLRLDKSDIVKIPLDDSYPGLNDTASAFDAEWEAVVADLRELDKGSHYCDLQATSVLPGISLIDKMIEVGRVETLETYFLSNVAPCDNARG